MRIRYRWWPIIFLFALLISGGCSKVEHQSIHSAAEYGDIDAIKSFLNVGIDINLVDTMGDTPIMRAAANDQLAAVLFLQQNGGDIYKKGSLLPLSVDIRK